MTTTLQRWTRDDWVLPCTLRDPTGTAINLAGTTVGAELWLAGYAVFSPLSVANGGIVRQSDAAGQFTVVVSRLLTVAARGRAGETDPRELTRILVYGVDSAGWRQTYGVIVFDVFDAADTRSIDQIPPIALVSQSTSLELVVATSQGAPGATSVTAAQITDAGATGRQILQAASIGAVRTMLSLPSIGRHAVADSDYTVQAADTYVALTTLTAPRTLRLPQAGAYPVGLPLWIADETGACSTDRQIVVAADPSDTIVGQPNAIMASPYQRLALHSNGTNLWVL